jgi:DNA-binding NtrC family response regulator
MTYAASASCHPQHLTITLESGEIRPVGASRSRKVGCRIIAATNTNLEELSGKGGFRKDLLFRLRRLELAIPPLRDRKEDILALAHHFLREGRADGRSPTLSIELQNALLGRPWSGNVRELRNEMERMRLLGSEKLAYDVADLSAAGSSAPEPASAPATESSPPAEAPPSAKAPETKMAEVLAASRSPLRRLERLRSAFRQSPTLTRQEVIGILGISHVTATRDLALLCREGFVERVMPNASPRTHYFRLR